MNEQIFSGYYVTCVNDFGVLKLCWHPGPIIFNNLFLIVECCGGFSSSIVRNEGLGSPCVFVDPRCICI